MRIFILFLIFLFSLLANDKVYNYASSEECKACHSNIYNEFTGSMHANSTPQKDPIHASVWDKHPQNLKQERYGCGKCHTPAANDLEKMKTKGEKALSPLLSFFPSAILGNPNNPRFSKAFSELF